MSKTNEELAAEIEVLKARIKELEAKTVLPMNPAPPTVLPVPYPVPVSPPPYYPTPVWYCGGNTLFVAT